MKKIDRRSFLRLSGMVGLGIASFTIPSIRAESLRFNDRLYKVSCTRLGMGTFISMTLFHPSKARAEEAIEKAFDEINILSKELSRFNSISAVAQLNNEGRLNDIPPHMVELIKRSLNYYKLSNGSFDVTVKPIIDLFQKRFSNGSRPKEAEINDRLRLIGSNKIEFSGKKIFFKEPGMGITLDGIAKGYIVDHAAQVLNRHGIKNYLINAGGDIRVAGIKANRKPWTIAVQDPNKKGNYPAIIHMSKGAIATSGSYEIYFDKEKMFYHIVDPQTGLSPRSDVSVSIISRTCVDADALSTAVFVMEPRDGIRFVNSLPGRETLIITKNGKQFRSSGWKRLQAT
ncbi:MAG: FAD:protein FMN transferase [Deltaproteobacteria bacterium]|nr:MAG: FAD:protein FMN transferase [Deltaproteobacteria bacterium]